MSHTVRIVSDFTVDMLARMLAARRPASFEISVAPYGQVVQSLDRGHANAVDTLFVWVQADAVLPSLKQAKNGHPVTDDDVVRDVEAFFQALELAAQSARQIFVASFEVEPGQRGFGPADYLPGIGQRWLTDLARMHLGRLVANLPNVRVLNAADWTRGKLDQVTNPRLWFAAKVPFSLIVFDRAIDDLLAAIDAGLGLSRRLIVLDLDNTLWGGILGDDGWENLTLGGHDHVGEAFAAFQQRLKALNRRGILLALASKNYEDKALEAIDKNSEMVLSRNDFASWQINWQDKAANLEQIAKDVNLGLKSIVFIDDNPAERARVKEALPDVLVPDWPEDPCLYVAALNRLSCFDTLNVTSEDLARSKSFVSERERRQVQRQTANLDDWLASIDMTLTFNSLNTANSKRIAQLYAKTNQFNLTTRRLTEQELQNWVAEDGHALWAVTVSDRFGEAGLTGIVTLDTTADQAVVTDMIMSCRIMGRKIENVMLSVALEAARKAGCSSTIVQLIPTDRNQPIRDFLETSGLNHQQETDFVWDNSNDYSFPDFFAIDDQSVAPMMANSV